MEEHSQVGQQRVDALPVEGSDGKFVEGVGHECDDRQEENQGQHQHGAGVRQRVAKMTGGLPDGYAGHDRKGKGNVKQGAFVAGVEGDPGKLAGHGQVAVSGYVGHLEILGDK